MKIHKFQDNPQQVEELARAIAQSIQTTLQKQDHATLAVSGGKSPIKLFERLSRYDLAWEKVTITLVDERFLAVDHPDSNENLVRNHLLINHAEKAFFNGLVTTRNALTSVSNANLHIKQIDIAILGMGEDGHTASIFPCCAELDAALDPQLTPEKYIITHPKTANHERIGLSLSGILEIPQIYISLNGAKKLEIIQDAAQAKTKYYPISYVLAERHDAEIFWNA